ncbi:MAG: DNA recombinase [bacterium]
MTRDTFLPILKENIAMALNNNNGSAIAELDARLEELQKELIRKTDAHQNTEELSKAIDELRDEKQALLMEDANNKSLRDRIAELEDFLDAQETYVTEYSEQLVRTLIEKITVFDNYFTVEFKSGMETNVQI